MTLKGRVGLLGLMGVAVIVASVAAVVLFAGSTGAVSPSPVSNNGTPIDLSGISAQDKHALDSTGVDGNPRLLRVIHGRAFYRFSGKAGEDCYATGSSAQAPPSSARLYAPRGSRLNSRSSTSPSSSSIRQVWSNPWRCKDSPLIASLV
jgi:hypothetical protein